MDEVLDWDIGLDEAGRQGESLTIRSPHPLKKRFSGRFEDAEDAISLGSDEAEQETDVAGRQDQPTADVERSRSPRSPVAHHLYDGSETPGRDTNRKQFSNAHASRRRSHSRSRSVPKITHALPPKPVVSSVPFVHPSDPKIFEATAMSRTAGRVDRDKRGNTMSGKPADGTEPLPPNWETRHSKSRTGVYYYNVVTHVSTWTHPLSTHDSSPSREDMESSKAPPSTARPIDREPGTDMTDSEHSVAPRPSRYEPRVQRSADILSYKDRHYRPSDNTAYSRRDDRPVPPSPEDKIERPRSALEYRQDRFRSSPRRSSFSGAAENVPFMDAQEPVAPSERREIASAEGVQRRQPPSLHKLPSGIPLPSPVSLLPADRRSNGNDALPAPRHRSPPPHHREGQTTSMASHVPSQIQGETARPPLPRSRPNTRFDRPAKTAEPQSQTMERDAYLDADAHKRPWEPELNVVRTDEDTHVKQNPTDEYNVDQPTPRQTTSPRVSDTGPTASLDRLEPIPSPPPLSSSVEQSRARKRQPLPPQSTHFKEASQVQDQPPTYFAPPAPSWRREDESEPTGNAAAPTPAPWTLTSQSQQPPVKDSYERDFVSGLRFPPSGPPAPLAAKHHPHPTVEGPPSDAAHHRSDWDADIDAVPPRSGARDVPIKNSGMYADRELLNDSLPTGPRYRRVNTFPTGPSSHAVSPATPLPPHRSLSSHEQGDSKPKASPPRMPFVIDNNWQQHPGQQSGPRESEQQRWTPVSRDRNVAQSQVGRYGQGYMNAPYQYERQGQGSYRTRHPPGPYGQSVAPHSVGIGINNAPIGSRREDAHNQNSEGDVNYDRPPAPSRHNFSITTNADPYDDRSVRMHGRVHDGYERYPPVTRGRSPVDNRSATGAPRRPSFAEPRARSPDLEYRSRSPAHPYPPSGPMEYSRHQNHYATRHEQNRIDPPTHENTRNPTGARVWTARNAPRNPSPPPMSRTGGPTIDAGFRPASPPLSKPATNSSGWDNLLPAVETLRQSRSDDRDRPPPFDAFTSHPKQSQGRGEGFRDRYAVGNHHHPPTDVRGASPRFGDRYEGQADSTRRPSISSAMDPPPQRHYTPHDPESTRQGRPPARPAMQLNDHRRRWEYNGEHGQNDTLPLPPPLGRSLGPRARGPDEGHPHPLGNRDAPSPGRDRDRRGDGYPMPPSSRDREPYHGRPDGPVPPDSWRRRGSNPSRPTTGQYDREARPSSSHNATRPGGSLLDRLSLDVGDEPSMDNKQPITSPVSLRDRVHMPTKRDRDDDMMEYDEYEDDGEPFESGKRGKKRNIGKVGNGRGRRG